MRLAVVLLVGLGLLAAVCAAVLVRTMGMPVVQAPKVTEQEPMVDVLVAGQDIPAMTIVTGQMVRSKAVRKSELPPEALTSSVQVVGRVLATPVVQGAAFSKSSFAREGSPLYLAAALPAGKRAVSIQLSDWSGMAGLLYPGSVVDVLVSFKSATASGRGADEYSTTLLQGLQVLAVGSQSITSEEYKDKEPGALAARGAVNQRMVTLLVDTRQARLLQLAMNNGSVTLAMRNPRDTATVRDRVTRASELRIDSSDEGAIAEEDGSDVGSAGLLAMVSGWMKGRSSAAAAAPATAPSGTAMTAAETPVPLPPAAAGPSLWEVLIIRGQQSETRTFRLSDNKPVGSSETQRARNDDPDPFAR